MNSIVHFEIPFENKDRAMKFYKEVFQWEIQDMPEMNYVITRTAPVDEKFMPIKPGAINGGMMKRSDKIKSPVITIDVKNIDQAMKEIEKSGGKVIEKKLDIGDMGYASYFKDTEGNIIGLWQSKKK